MSMGWRDFRMRLKKIKNAKEMVEASKYYVANPAMQRGKWHALFGNDHPIHVEIGMGKGRFIIQMAMLHPEVNFIGIEKYDSVLVKATKALESLAMLPNLKLLLADAEEIVSFFEKEIAQIYLNFSDPWPKSKHEKRRLTSHPFLEKYDAIFETDSMIVQKTDNREFFDYSCESLKQYGYELTEVTYDLYAEEDVTNVPTEYEEKFHRLGVNINRVKAQKKNESK